MRLAIVVVLAACASNKSASTTGSALPKGPDCAIVAGKMAEHMLASSPDTVRIIEKRCTEDQWSLDARECLAKMESERDADRCASMLTDSQKAALVKDERERHEQADKNANPPPPPPPPTRGPIKRDKDPCQGGEEDPCQGGEREQP